MTTEPSKQQIKDTFLNAANRGDLDTAAKIAVYSALTPESADAFSVGLIAMVEAVLEAREEDFKGIPEGYISRGIDRACKKLDVHLQPHHRKVIEAVNLKHFHQDRISHESQIRSH